MLFHEMVFCFVAVFTCLMFHATHCDIEETKRILASDPNYVHSLELSVQDLKQKYETSNAHFTSEVDAQRTLTSHLVTELDAQRTLISQLTTESEKQQNESKSSISNLTSELVSQRAITSHVLSELQTQKTLTSQLTLELAHQRNNSTSTISHLESDLQSQKTLTSKLTSDITKLKQEGHGGTYVRWGRNTCPDNSTELVYLGFAGGSWYNHPGAAANYICLPSDPQWYSTATSNGAGRVYGAEYQGHFAGSATIDDDVPCCVCRPATRSSILMIPGRTSCYPGWQTEYQGYLASGYYDHKAASEYVCLDKHPEAVFGGHENKDGAFFEEVAAECGSLPCPPYFQGRRMDCVVCSK